LINAVAMRDDQLIEIPRKQPSQGLSSALSVSKRQRGVQRNAAVQNSPNFLYDISPDTATGELTHNDPSLSLTTIIRVGSEETTNRTLGDQNIFGKALQAIYIASHHAKQAAIGQSATPLNAEAIKLALVLAAALVAGVRCDRLPIADSQNELLRVSKSADRNKLFHRNRLLEAITLWRNRL
jgi:hypothetical protein